MTTGTEIRLNRILRKGKMLCIPMDHGISNGPIEGLEKPHSMIYKCETHGVTSVIINKGIIKTFPRPPKVGILVHYSASTSLSTAPNRKMLTGSVEEALRLGADGVSLHINIGGKEEPEMLQDLGNISEQCHKWNVPLLAMMYPRGENIKDPHDPEIVAHAARIGAGPKSETDMDLLKMTEDAMSAGAKGVTYGRNIFAHKNPEKIVEALAGIIFKNQTSKEAAEKL